MGHLVILFFSFVFALEYLMRASSRLYQPLFIQDTTSFTCLIPYHVYMNVYVMYILHIYLHVLCILYMLYLHRSFFYQVVSLLFANSRNDKRCMYRKFEVRPLGHLENKGIYPQYSKH